MNNPNEYIEPDLAKEYMNDCLQYEQTLQMLKRKNKNNLGRIYCMVCLVLLSFGHMLISLGKRLESYEIVLRQSERYKNYLSP